MAFYQLKNKTLLIMLFLLTFVGQSMASSIMSYEMTAMKLENAQIMAMMSHDMHEMDNGSDVSYSSSDDCCSQSCDCFVSGCATVALVSDLLDSQAAIDTTTQFYLSSTFILNQFPKSLYRPPITA